ncbi:flotillin family protein [Cellulosilyticum ruminicola]|uniref:flotillin family protein n=1 Tax=Cellulosilyticum ruminicola TaxID=425254 RepID=UPI00278C803A|nr:SPFH domain-containing protein [Cellulosilyticum ruminicola]
MFVDVVGTAVVKVHNDPGSIIKAVERFCTGKVDDTVGNIQNIVEKILEGKLRGIVSTLTVEQINEDRASFEQSIEDNIREELDSMGLELISYSILKIATQGGYLENRAKPQIAQAQADADIAEAERKRDTEIRTAESIREGQRAKLASEAEIAEFERNKKIKTESYRAEQDKAKADADVAYSLKEIENKSLVEQQKAKLAEEEAKRVEKELVATIEKPAEADKKKKIIEAQAAKEKAIQEAEADAKAIQIKAEAEANAKRIIAEAEADAIRAAGEAEASIIKAKGIADAEAKEKLADAMSKYGEAAIIQMVVEKLPDIMREAAKPMEQIDKITVIDNGGQQGASKVAKLVTDITGNGFETLNTMTGINIPQLIEKFTNTKDNSIVSNISTDNDNNE